MSESIEKERVLTFHIHNNGEKLRDEMDMVMGVVEKMENEYGVTHTHIKVDVCC